jgi:hypothetical protein
VKIEETSRPRAKVTELLHKEDDIGGTVGRGVGLVVVVVVSSSEEGMVVVVVIGGTVVVEVASSNTVVVEEEEGGGTVAPVLCEFDVVTVVAAGAVNATQPTLVSASPSAQHEPDPNPAQ